MTHSLFSSLRVRLMLLVLLAAIPISALMLYTASEDRLREKNKVLENCLLLAQLISSNQERLIEAGRHLLTGLAQLPEVRSRNPEACSSILANILKQHPRYANIGAVEPDGNIFCSGLPLNRPINIKDFPAIKRTIQTREFTVGNYQIGLMVGRPILSLNYPVLDASGRIQVIVFATLDLSRLSQLTAYTKLPPGSILTIFDRNGMILARNPNPEKWIGKSMPEKHLLETILSKQIEGTTESVAVDGVRRLYAVAHLNRGKQAEAYLVIGIPTQIAFAQVKRILKRSLTFLGLVVVLVLAAAWVSGDLLVLRPMNALLNASRRMSTGDLSVRSGLPYQKGEIGQLARAFDEMAEALEKHEAELRRYAERLRLLHKTDQAILAAKSLEAIAQAAVSHIRKLLPCMRASVVMFNLEAHEAKVLAVEVEADTSLGKGAVVPLELFGDIEEFGRGKINFVDDIQTLIQTSQAVEALVADGVRSYVNIPLIARGQLIGALNIGSKRPGDFDVQSIEIAREVADSLAVAMQDMQLREEAMKYQRELQRISARIIKVQEMERKRISLELHDQMGQTLTAMGLNLAAIEKELLADLNLIIKDKLKEIYSMIDQASEQIREMSFALRPSMLDDLGLVPTLRWYLNNYARRTNIEVKFEAIGVKRHGAPEVETALYRIVQEALTNVAKHAEARNVHVALEKSEDTITASIEDDGKGFDVNEVLASEAPESGIGIIGMRERAASLGGRLSLDSRPGHGTRISVKIPLQRRQGL